MRRGKKTGEQETLLARALVAIKDVDEAQRMLRVALTPREVTSVAKRFSVLFYELKARANGKNLTQRQLVERVGCSPAKVVRARRVLQQEDHEHRFAALIARLS